MIGGHGIGGSSSYYGQCKCKQLDEHSFAVGAGIDRQPCKAPGIPKSVHAIANAANSWIQHREVALLTSFPATVARDVIATSTSKLELLQHSALCCNIARALNVAFKLATIR